MRKETASASGLQHSSRALERGRIPSGLLANIRSMGKINNGLLFHKINFRCSRGYQGEMKSEGGCRSR